METQVEEAVKNNEQFAMRDYESSVLHLPQVAALREVFKDLKGYIRPYWVSTAASESIPATTTKLVTFRISSDILFVWTRLMANPSASTMSLRILNPSSGVAYAKSAVPSAAIAGSGLRPYNLTLPTFFRPNSDIVVEITNSGASAITPNVTLCGYCVFVAELPAKLREKLLYTTTVPAYHYWLVLDTAPVTVTTTRTEYLMSSNVDGVFLVEQLLANYSTDFNIKMRETHTGHEIIRDGRANNIFGTGLWNFKIPYPLIMSGGSQLAWTVWTDSGTTSLHIIAAGIQIPERGKG